MLPVDTNVWLVAADRFPTPMTTIVNGDTGRGARPVFVDQQETDSLLSMPQGLSDDELARLEVDEVVVHHDISRRLQTREHICCHL